MDKIAVYIHGKDGNVNEAEHYKPLFPQYDVKGFDYKAQTPWEAKKEFPFAIRSLCKEYESVTLIANSIGAYFALHSLAGQRIEKAFLISPIVDMEELIIQMMAQAGIIEGELEKRKEIYTSCGEKLSWEYLCYVRKNPLAWNIPTEVLYGESDHMISCETISAFVRLTGAGLTVMKGGEHWFHTKEQMAFLDAWIKRSQ